MNKAISQLRYKRQHLLHGVSEKEYDEMFKEMSPVQTQFWIEPGTPPSIQYRCDFDDVYANDMDRRMRKILKGRFQGGNVAYVQKEDMPLYAAAYKKEIKSYNEHDQIILDILTKEGPMTNSLLKEISGLLSKEVSKSLMKLQKAFILFEDQIDKDNDRAWYFLEEELSDLDFHSYTKQEALVKIIEKLAYLNVVINESMIKSATRLSNKEIKLALNELITNDSLTEFNNKLIKDSDLTELVGGNKDYENVKQYVLATDIDSLINEEKTSLTSQEEEIFNKVFVLDLNDYLVKSNELMLKDAFATTDYKTLRYLYLKGEFIGRVVGYFRYGPDDVEDIQLIEHKKASISQADKALIIDAVNDNYKVEGGLLKRYLGEVL